MIKLKKYVLKQEEAKEVEVVKLPVSFTPEVVDAIVKDIKLLGLTLSDCAKKLRLPPENVHHWYKNNINDFKLMVDEARVHNKSLHIGRVVSGKDKLQVSASQWVLERKHAKEFGSKTTNTTIINFNEINVISSQMLDIIARHLANVDPTIVMRIAEDIKALKNSQAIEIEAELV